MNKWILGGLLLSCCIFASCNNKDVYNGEDDQTSEKSDFFDFSTMQEVQLNVSYEVPEGFRVYFEAYTENPLFVDEYGNYVKKDGILPFLEGYTNTKGVCELPVTLPAYATDIYVYSPTVGVPVILSGKIENKKTVLEQSEVLAQSMTKAPSQPYYTDWKKQNVRLSQYISIHPNGLPQPMADPIKLDKKTMQVIDATIPKDDKLDLIFSQLQEVEISEEANVKLYYVSSALSTRRNSLAYYVFTGEQPTQEYINNNLILLYPCLKNGRLQPGDGMQLKYPLGEGVWQNEFPAGTKIGFVLLVDAWQEGENEVAVDNINVMYSCKKYNRYTIPGVSIMGDRPQMASFNANGNFILSFEDQPWTATPSKPQYWGDFRDNIFILKTDPTTALPDIEDGQDPEEPSGTLTFINKGILAFEDVWPYKGDYDMNDVVLKYQSSLYLKDYEITAVADTFTFLNNGAAYENGFGYSMNVDRSAIKNVTVTSSYKCTGQGLDLSSNETIIMLFDNARNVPAGTKFIVRIDFNAPQSLATNFYAPYNPFIVVGNFLENGRKEVHLINHKPTFKMNMDFLGYGHDLSVPSKGLYYVSDAQYPFAIHIMNDDFKIPAETQKISDAYPRFDSWARSSGKLDKDWYKYPKE